MKLHPFPAFGTGALATLHAGGLVLLPTANLWQVVCHGGQTDAIHRLLTVCPPSKINRPELVFPDAALMRLWCPRVDPILDTLLHHHQRALTLSVPAGPLVPLPLIDDRGEVAVRLAMDSACYRLCEDLEFPLVAGLAIGRVHQELPRRFGRISSDVLRSVDHIVKRRQLDLLGEEATVMVRMNKAGEIEFIRS